MPLPNTSVIPDGWSAHHRPVPAGASTATVTITRPGGAGVWDPSTGNVTNPAGTSVYAGPARVQAQVEDRSADAAGQQVAERAYLVSIPDHTAVVKVADRIHVDASEDPLIVGFDLTVTSVQVGSLVWDRAVACVLDAANT